MAPLFRTILLLLPALWLPAALSAQQAEPAGADSGVAAGQSTVRPGDRIWLRIWNEPEMSDTFNISERGEVILPKLGAVYVADRGVAALQDSIRAAYAVYLRNPSVEIVVLRRIGIQGEVRRPGIYMADLTMALPDVIALAGGFTDAANPDNIVVLRGSERIRYRRSNQTQFLVTGLQSGDQVLVKGRSSLARNPVGTMTAVFAMVGGFFQWVYPPLKDALGID